MYFTYLIVFTCLFTLISSTEKPSLAIFISRSIKILRNDQKLKLIVINIPSSCLQMLTDVSGHLSGKVQDEPKLLDDGGKVPKPIDWLTVRFLAVKLSLYLTEN